MHHILEIDCTGCGLCVEPCPVDCIEMEELPQVMYDKNRARERYQGHLERLDKEARSSQNKRQTTHLTQVSTTDKQHYIQEALLRIQQKKQQK